MINLHNYPWHNVGGWLQPPRWRPLGFSAEAELRLASVCCPDNVFESPKYLILRNRTAIFYISFRLLDDFQ